MKQFIKVVLSLLLLVSVIACQSRTEKDVPGTDATDSTMANVTYTCSMHPDVISDKPGTCPKCGMELTKKESESHDHTHSDSTKHE